ISQADAGILVTAFSGIYDGSGHGVISSSATGVNHEALTGLAIHPTTYSLFPYTTLFRSFSNTNYKDQSGNATVTITQADAAIVVTDFSGIYDDSAHGVVSSSATGVNHEALTGLAIDSTTYSDVPGGLVHWSFSNTNYKDQSGDAAVTITQADATIVVTGFSGV